MEILVKCYATLAQYQPVDGDRFFVKPGTTVAQLMDQLGLPEKEVKVIFVNGRHVDAATELSSGDRVALFPAVGGG